MRRLLTLAILLLPLSARATFTLVQNPTNTCGGSTCAITVSATGANDLGVLIAIDDTGTPGNFISSVSGFTVPTSCQASGDSGSVSCAYDLSLPSGTTGFTLTMAASGTYFIQFWEYSSTHTFVYDTGGTVIDNLGVIEPWPGVALTLSGTNDVIIQTLSNYNSETMTISSPYGNLSGSGYVWAADSENTNSGTAPTWTTGGGSATRHTEGAIAIKEGPLRSTPRQRSYVIRN